MRILHPSDVTDPSSTLAQCAGFNKVQSLIKRAACVFEKEYGTPLTWFPNTMEFPPPARLSRTHKNIKHVSVSRLFSELLSLDTSGGILPPERFLFTYIPTIVRRFPAARMTIRQVLKALELPGRLSSTRPLLSCPFSNCTYSDEIVWQERRIDGSRNCSRDRYDPANRFQHCDTFFLRYEPNGTEFHGMKITSFIRWMLYPRYQLEKSRLKIMVAIEKKNKYINKSKPFTSQLETIWAKRH